MPPIARRTSSCTCTNEIPALAIHVGGFHLVLEKFPRRVLGVVAGLATTASTLYAIFVR